jgi:ammonia channel protein AmtB
LRSVRRSAKLSLVSFGSWFGWFGFDAGSALAANGVAALAFVNTNTAAAAALATWALIDTARLGKATAVGADGLIAGNAAQLGVQLLAVLAAVGIAAVGTVAAYALVHVTLGARATVHDELAGLDPAEHGEEAYFGADVGAVAGPGFSLGGSVIVATAPATSPAASAPPRSAP